MGWNRRGSALGACLRRALFSGKVPKAVSESAFRHFFLCCRLGMRRVQRAMKLLVQIDMGLERQCSIEQRFDSLLPMVLDRFFNPVGLRSCVLNDVRAGHLCEPCEQM